MFSKSKKTSSGQNEHSLSIVSQGSTFNGDLISENLHVEGKVEGSIRAHSVLLGETGDVSGDIMCENIEVRGKVNGNIDAQSVTLSHHSHVEGSVMYQVIDVATGAFLNARCTRRESASEKPDDKNERPKDKDETENPAAVHTGVAGKIELVVPKTG